MFLSILENQIHSSFCWIKSVLCRMWCSTIIQSKSSRLTNKTLILMVLTTFSYEWSSKEVSYTAHSIVKSTHILHHTYTVQQKTYWRNRIKIVNCWRRGRNSLLQHQTGKNLRVLKAESKYLQQDIGIILIEEITWNNVKQKLKGYKLHLKKNRNRESMVRI